MGGIIIVLISLLYTNDHYISCHTGPILVGNVRPKKTHDKNIAIQNLMSAYTQSLPNLPGESTATSSAGVDPSKLWTVSALAALPLTLYCQLALNASLAARTSSRVSNRAEVFLTDRCPVLEVKLSQSLCFPDPRSA